MDNNYFDLQGGGGIIDHVVNGKRCALRSLFGLVISPQTPQDLLKLARRALPASCATERCQSLAD